VYTSLQFTNTLNPYYIFFNYYILSRKDRTSEWDEIAYTAARGTKTDQCDGRIK